MPRLSRSEFENLVRAALEGLPDQFWDRLDNVDVVVEYEPTLTQLARNGIAPGSLLLGLYEGVPLTAREHYGLALPDKITIFQRPLESICSTTEELVEEARNTVVHEIAHHFGIDDEKLHSMGLWLAVPGSGPARLTRR